MGIKQMASKNAEQFDEHAHRLDVQRHNLELAHHAMNEKMGFNMDKGGERDLLVNWIGDRTRGHCKDRECGGSRREHGFKKSDGNTCIRKCTRCKWWGASKREEDDFKNDLSRNLECPECGEP